jgi:DNA-binding CsgD family transcriptional regulator
VILLGAVAALREVGGTAFWVFDRLAYERSLDSVRKKLDELPFNAAWAQGRALSLEQAIEVALKPLPGTSARASATYQAARLALGGLTRREQEAVALIALGRSNREIAAAMTVGEKTVETYVTRILSKLGFNSRVQIATWAIHKGIALSDKPD